MPLFYVFESQASSIIVKAVQSRPIRILKCWVPVLVWMAVIFAASADQDSMYRTKQIVTPVVKWLFPDISWMGLDQIIALVRKGAHVFVYAVLAGLLWYAFTGTLQERAKGWNWRPVFWTMSLIVVYAASDEIHQRFVPNRGSSYKDVIIDTTGAAAAMGLVWVSGRCRHRW